MSQEISAAGLIAGTGAGLYGGNKAASAQRAASADAANRINAAKGEAIGYLQPYADIGQQALSPLTALLVGKSYNSNTGEFTDLNQEQRLSNFFESPAYQFNLSQGMSAINKAQIAKGMSLSGGAFKEIANYAQGNASNEWQNQLNNLFQLAGIGQNASTAQANTAIGAGSDLASLAYAGGMGNVNKYNNISNFGYGIAGTGYSNLAGGGSGGGSGGASSGGGTVNMGAFNQATSNFLGF